MTREMEGKLWNVAALLVKLIVIQFGRFVLSCFPFQLLPGLTRADEVSATSLNLGLGQVALAILRPTITSVCVTVLVKLVDRRPEIQVAKVLNITFKSHRPGEY
jgi:hypothetical protein